MNEKSRQFETEIDIQAPCDAVWQALTDAQEIMRWFAPVAKCEPRVGGHMEWQWGEQHDWRQTIEAIEPSVHLRTRYDSAVDDGRGGKRPLFVDFHLEGKGGTTTLRLVHSGFGPEADFDAEYHGISGGWPAELRSLRLYLEQHRGKDRQLAWSLCSTRLAPEVAWQRLLGREGLDCDGLSQLSEGDRFTIGVPGVDSITGTTLFAPSQREFSGIADSVGRGWLRLHCEHWAGATQIWLWLAAYDCSPAVVNGYQRAFDAVLQRLFADDAVQTGTTA